MTACAQHRRCRPVITTPFQPGPEPYTCKGCGNQVGTEAYRAAHHCPCCGEKVEESCLGTGRGAARCPHCGRIDSKTLAFLPELDPIADLLTGKLQLPADFTAVQRARQMFGDDVAHFLSWSWQDRTYHHGALVVHCRELKMRFHTTTGQFEAARNCSRPGCRGRIWWTVSSHHDLLALHRGTPVGAPTQCNRCG